MLPFGKNALPNSRIVDTPYLGSCRIVLHRETRIDHARVSVSKIGPNVSGIRS